MAKGQVWNKLGDYSNVKGLIAREMLSRIYRQTHYLPRSLTPRKILRFSAGKVLETAIGITGSTGLWKKMPNFIKPDQKQRLNLELHLAWPREAKDSIMKSQDINGEPAGPSHLSEDLSKQLKRYLQKGWKKEEMRRFLVRLILTCF